MAGSSYAQSTPRLIRDRGLTAVLLAWSAGACALWLQLVHVAHAGAILRPLPAAAVLALLDRREDRSRALTTAALVALGVGVAIAVAPTVANHPHGALGAVGVVAVGIAYQRWGSVIVIAGLFLSAASASLEALTSLPVQSLTDLTLNATVVGGVLALIIGSRAWRVRIPIATVPMLAFGMLAIGWLVTAEDRHVAWDAFHVLELHVLVGLAVAFTPLSQTARRRILWGVLTVAALAGGYAVLRWIIGPAAQERALVLSHQPAYNFTDGKLNVFGSFPNTRSLGVWTSILVPFTLACALGLAGRMRRLAAVGAGLCFAALLGSHLRAGIPAVVAGALLVTLLLMAGRAWRGPRLGTALAILVIAVGGTIAVAARSPGPGRSDKSYATALLHPGSDASFSERKIKWSQGLRQMRDHPFGQGLGTSGQAYLRGGRFITISTFDIDSSYIKVGLDLGIPGLMLLALIFVTLLTDLGRFGLATRSPEDAALAIGAVGALVSFFVVNYSGDYIEGLPALPAWVLCGLALNRIVHHAQAPA